MYNEVFSRPTGLAMALHTLIPARWLLLLPAWTNASFLGQPLWRGACILVVFATFFGVFWLSLRLARRWRAKSSVVANASSLLPILSVLLLAPATDYVMGEVLLVPPSVYGGITISLWALFYLALTWMVWVLGSLIAEGIIGFERVQSGSVDSQLIRLGARLIALFLAVGILIEGANRLGLPSYSVLAGLGIGGLAMALAGQQALANLFGSLIIMLEKPFRIGHSIRTSGIEGRVEDIGFRSTRLRTPDNTLMIVPSSDLIRHTIENLTARKVWRVKRTLYLSVITPVARLCEFKADVEAVLRNEADVKHDAIRVVLTQIGLNGFELLVDFAIRAPDDAAQLRKNDQILTAIANLAERHRIDFDQGSR
jgi:MscS family membrane protein